MQIAAKPFTHCGLSLRHGTSVRVLPPDFSKSSRPSIPSSSIVSKLSTKKAGEARTNLLIPLPGKSSSVLSVYGLSQETGPSRDWKLTVYFESDIPKALAIRLDVSKT